MTIFHQETSDCIEWTGGKDKDGYGKTKRYGRHLRAHRWVFVEKENLPIWMIDGLVVRHTCDNPSCVNPDHLVLGTWKDNTRDCTERGRRAMLFGEESPRAILTEVSVIEIRKRAGEGEAKRHLAKEYGVSEAAIHKVINRHSWKHVE